MTEQHPNIFFCWRTNTVLTRLDAMALKFAARRLLMRWQLRGLVLPMRTPPLLCVLLLVVP